MSSIQNNLLEPVDIGSFSSLKEKSPSYAIVENTDLVVIKADGKVSVLYGRCLHRGALLCDGHIDGQNLVCGVHNWDYRYDSGVSEYANDEALKKFSALVKEDRILVDRAEIITFEELHPQPFQRDEYQGTYADTHPEDTEPHTRYIQSLAKDGLTKVGHHGPSAAMGVDRNTLPKWDNIQYLPAQLASKPLLDDVHVDTKVVIGQKSKRPLLLNIPLFVSDMSYGALSREAKISLSKGAEMSGTGICSGEGGMLPDEQKNNSRYFYELASAQFGFSLDKVAMCQAFHFKGGQGAKTGTGGHLPGEKVSEEIAAVRGLKPGQAAISPATFINLKTASDFAEIASQVREVTGGIPIGFKIAASHIEKDLAFAVECGVDYIILDGRGGGTGAAPTILRDHINVPTIPALARARKFLDNEGLHEIDLIITGGLRTPADFAKALMMGADAIAISNSALQAIGCLGMRACHTNNCPVGIATQKPHLRERLDIDKSANQLHNYLTASNELIKVVARACGYNNINQFNQQDLITANWEIHKLTRIPYAGIG